MKKRCSSQLGSVFFNFRLKLAGALCFFFLFSLSSFAQDETKVNRVDVVELDGTWTLRVNGEPFYIRGAGGEKHLDKLIECGGNTIRTWGIENAQEVLDNAEAKGLKVMLGLWVQHERHGFDYNDEDKIAKQLASFRESVRKYKDHPALLMWGIGNEYELEYSNTKVWKAVNDIALMVKAEDPNHPTSTVTAGTNAVKLAFVQNELTAIDIYGINTYGDIGSVHSVLETGKYTGPYMITEWGPNGHWESPKTRWGASIEQTSTEKAAVYLERYEKYIWDQRAQCLGSFAFLWGQKQEYTSTWYGLFTENDEPTEALDVLCLNWKGAYPENRSPSIVSVKMNQAEIEKNTILKSGSDATFTVVSEDINMDKLRYSWELYPESTDLKSGGDAESKPISILGNLRGKNSAEVDLKVPQKEGKYRLFVTVTDGDKIAYANIPFYVEVDGSASDSKIRFTHQEMKSFEE